jgi:hypothetical protein
MKMRALPNGLELPAGKAVELKPGGYHVMLMDLKQQLKAGDTVPLTLVVEGKDGKKESIELKAPVKDLAAAGGPNLRWACTASRRSLARPAPPRWPSTACRSTTACFPKPA